MTFAEYVRSYVHRCRQGLALATAIAALTSGVATAQERTLRVVGPWEIAGLESTQSGYVFGRMQVAETLATVDERGQIVPHLAKAWTVSSDGLTWRFELREGVRFHDNTPVTAEAAAKSSPPRARARACCRGCRSRPSRPMASVRWSSN